MDRENAMAIWMAAMHLLLTSGGAPVARVAKVENCGLLFTDNGAGVSGTDCGYSVPIGRQTLWLFGDVFLLAPADPQRPYVGGVSNCGLVVPAGNGVRPLSRARFLTNPASGLARALLPNRPGEDSHVRYWLFGSHFGPATGRLHTWYARIETTGGGGPFDFRTTGHGLAVADTGDLAHFEFRPLPGPSGAVEWWPAGSESPLFGNAVLDAGRTIYVYGMRDRAGRRECLLARVDADRLETLSAYEYLADAGHWTADPRAAAAVAGIDGASEMTVAWNGFLRKYLAVASVGLSERCRLSTADHPWGPFEQLAEIGTPHQAFARSFCYAAKEHPEMAERGGKVIYITYVDQQRYWLQLLRVTLAPPGRDHLPVVGR